MSLMTTMQLEIVSRETIKPSSPTPDPLRIHNLSFFDRVTPGVYAPLVLFYPNEGSNSQCKIAEISARLKKSLSKILTQYYPLAGKIRDRQSIDCNDEGALFLEARMKCELSDILEHPKEETLNLLFPDDLHWKDANLSNALVVQITFFDCTGMAIGLCVCHKIVDMACICTFINQWAAIAHHPSEEISPEFTLGSMFPLGDLPIKDTELDKGKCVTRRFVFGASKIAALKAMAASKVQNPTRVEVVTALIYKCAISASRARSGLKPTLLTQAVNLRTRVVPPLTENSAGNLTWFFPVSTMEESEIKLHHLVEQMREKLVQLCDVYARKYRGEWFSAILETMKESRKLYCSNQDLYWCSSWCRFPFYQVDFGWGKPMWVTTAGTGELKNMIFIIDTKRGDGVEAVVTLEEQEMAVFEHDGELLAFARINPSSLDTDLEFTCVDHN